MPSSTDFGLAAPLTVLSVVVILYSLLIVQQILLGILAVIAIWLLYLFYRLLVRLGRIATALERLVDQRIDEEKR
jgi:hypothetical protein